MEARSESESPWDGSSDHPLRTWLLFSSRPRWTRRGPLALGLPRAPEVAALPLRLDDYTQWLLAMAPLHRWQKEGGAPAAS